MQPIMFIPALRRTLDSRTNDTLSQVYRGNLLSANIIQSLISDRLDERAAALTHMRSVLLIEDLDEVARLLSISLQHDSDPRTLTLSIDLLLTLIGAEQAPAGSRRFSRFWYKLRYRLRTRRLQKTPGLKQGLLRLSRAQDADHEIRCAARRGLNALS